MAYDAIPKFMARLRDREAMAALALEFTVLTGARTGEVIGATWDEVDLERGRLAVRRALIPHEDAIIVSEPKTARGAGRCRARTDSTPIARSGEIATIVWTTTGLPSRTATMMRLK